jgi:glycosyltransferase involved in cell wall biosynthesis
LKGVQFLGNIINGVHTKLPDTKFLILGHDEVKNGVSEKEKLILSIKNTSNVDFINRVDNGFVSQLIRSSKVLILTSKTEALPTVVIEAFANERPVIAFNVGGLIEMIDDGIDGFLISPFSETKFVEKLLFILENDENRKNMNLAAYEKYLMKFKLNIQMLKLIEFYKNK